jgi:hypothetical protein
MTEKAPGGLRAIPCMSPPQSPGAEFMSHVLKIEASLLAKTLRIVRKPKLGKLIVGPEGELSPQAMNLRKNLNIKTTGMFTTAQAQKVFRTK